MLIDARFESSLTPPIRLTDSDLGLGQKTPGAPGETPGFSIGSFFRKLLLSIVRPKATFNTSLPYVKPQEWKPYGEPFPWQIGLALMLLGVAYLGHIAWKLLRR